MSHPSTPFAQDDPEPRRMGRVLGVIGSVREESHTARVVHLVLEAAAKAGAQTQVWDLRRDPFPIYNPDAEGDSPAVVKAREMLVWSDAVVLGSPDYHGSMSGAMKNFLDHFWREFAGRLFGYVCSGHEKGLTVMDHMRTSVKQCYGWSLPYGLGFNGDDDLAKDGTVKTERLARRIQFTGFDLARYGKLLHGQFDQDRTGDPVPGFATHYRK